MKTRISETATNIAILQKISAKTSHKKLLCGRQTSGSQLMHSNRMARGYDSLSDHRRLALPGQGIIDSMTVSSTRTARTVAMNMEGSIQLQ